MYRRNALYGHESAGEHSVETGLSFFFFFNYEQKPMEKGINVQDGMLGDVFLWLLLHNIIADKHIPYICVYFFCQREQNVHPEPNSLLCCWQRQGLIMGCFKPRRHQD